MLNCEQDPWQKLYLRPSGCALPHFVELPEVSSTLLAPPELPLMHSHTEGVTGIKGKKRICLQTYCKSEEYPYLEQNTAPGRTCLNRPVPVKAVNHQSPPR